MVHPLPRNRLSNICKWKRSAFSSKILGKLVTDRWLKPLLSFSRGVGATFRNHNREAEDNVDYYIRITLLCRIFSSVSVGVRTALQILNMTTNKTTCSRIRKMNHCGERTVLQITQNLAIFALRFCRRRLTNLLRYITHMQGHFTVH